MSEIINKKKSLSHKRKSNSSSNFSWPKEAKPEHYFILVTGVHLKNLKELANAFETMNDWVFKHHVNEERNDFATWIRDALSEPELAEEITIIKDINDMHRKLLRYLVNKYL